MKTLIRFYKKGFTLIEAMFGVFILVIGLVGAQQGIIACMLLNVSNNNLTVAANDAQYVMEQIKDLDYDTCIAQDFSNGCYTFPTFNNLMDEAVTHANVAVGTMRQVTITIQWTERQGQKEYSLATYFTH